MTADEHRPRRLPRRCRRRPQPDRTDQVGSTGPTRRLAQARPRFA